MDSDKVRSLVYSALHQRLERPSSRDTSFEEGMFIQQTLHDLIRQIAAKHLAHKTLTFLQLGEVWQPNAFVARTIGRPLSHKL